ncbi:MAG TPA: SPFH domain-containing protein [Acidimicrobiales bacterium]|nr:SPFH domain-containing protein [Acidimicrobiales bacterium]
MIMTAHQWATYSPREDEQLPRGKHIVVQPWERMVVLRRGAVVEVLEPGAHRRWDAGLRGRRVDTRPWVLHVPVQEVPTADGVTVKLSVAAEVRVADPVARVLAGHGVHERLYLRVQVALRDLVATSSVEDVVSGRAAVGARLASAVGDVSDLGVVVDRIEVKDVVLPAELKRAQAEVLLARAQGVAALERARAEAASLRTLANAARLATDLPALVELRLVQELGRSTGHTVVIGSAAGSAR